MQIRKAIAEEFETLGELTASAYAALAGMPGPDRFPDYYAELRDVAGRAALRSAEILVAVDADGTVAGGVTFVGDMKEYGVEETAGVGDAAGIRMLAIREGARGQGLGRRLTEACVARARELGRKEVLLHTTEPMAVARGLYERMGFQRSPELDFHPGGFPVLCLRLRL